MNTQLGKTFSEEERLAFFSKKRADSYWGGRDLKDRRWTIRKNGDEYEPVLTNNVNPVWNYDWKYGCFSELESADEAIVNLYAADLAELSTQIIALQRKRDNVSHRIMEFYHKDG